MDVTRVLVVDDDATMATATATVLREHAHDVRMALSGGEALDGLAERRADVVAPDFEMDDMTGGEVLAPRHPGRSGTGRHASGDLQQPQGAAAATGWSRA